jgi:hypothetical protein
MTSSVTTQTPLTKKELLQKYREQPRGKYEDIFEFARDYYNLLGIETHRLLLTPWYKELFTFPKQTNVASNIFGSNTTQINVKG